MELKWSLKININDAEDLFYKVQTYTQNEIFFDSMYQGSSYFRKYKIDFRLSLNDGDVNLIFNKEISIQIENLRYNSSKKFSN